jgi:hypothetical protein
MIRQGREAVDVKFGSGLSEGGAIFSITVAVADGVFFSGFWVGVWVGRKKVAEGVICKAGSVIVGVETKFRSDGIFIRHPDRTRTINNKI